MTIEIFRFEDSTLYLCDDCLNDTEERRGGKLHREWKKVRGRVSCSICGEGDVNEDSVYYPFREDEEENDYEQ